MAFWIFMLIMCLLCPGVMVVFGFLFMKRAPKRINALYGYRTTRSMSSLEAWQFAHYLFGRLWLGLGLIVLPISILVMVVFLQADQDLVGLVGLAICLVQLVVMSLPVFVVEKRLKERFDG